MYDLPSPTYVLDLGWVIPLFLATARLLRRRHPAGPVLAAVGLVWLLTVFGLLALVSGGLLAAGTRRLRPPAGPWLRPGLWGT